MLDNFVSVTQHITPAFVVISLGYLYNRLIKNEIEVLVKVSMNLLIPAFAFVHLYRVPIQGNLISTVFLSAWIVLLVPGVLAWIFFLRREMPHRGLYLPIIFMNSINLPFPILLSAYGDEAFPFALMFYLASLLGIFTIGLLIASGGKGTFQIIKEPALYAIACALFMNLNAVPLPEMLIQPLGLLESAAIPMVLLVLGMQLARVKIRQWKLPMIAVSLRLGGGLLAALICIWGFGLTDLARKVVLLEAVMPSAVMTALVAEKYQTDSELVASTVVLSTVISIVVIPLTLYLV